MTSYRQIIAAYNRITGRDIQRNDCGYYGDANGNDFPKNYPMTRREMLEEMLYTIREAIKEDFEDASGLSVMDGNAPYYNGYEYAWERNSEPYHVFANRREMYAAMRYALEYDEF